jgi:peptidoglycan/LPS O-acetylase OafA/YrhL
MGAALALWSDRRLLRSRSGALLGFVLVAAIVNAAVCGALSGPHDRYQSRLLWLLAACCISLVMEWGFARGTIRLPAGRVAQSLSGSA